MKNGNLTVDVHNTNEISGNKLGKRNTHQPRNLKRRRRIKETFKGILEFNIGRQYGKTGRQLELNTRILEYWKTIGINGTAWEDENKLKGKSD